MIGNPFEYPQRPFRTLEAPAPLPMTGNPYNPQTSEWWIWRLVAKLEAHHARLVTLDKYYRGTQDTFALYSLAAIQSGMADMFRGINANLAKLIVDAPRQRLEVFGFRSTDSSVDEDAWAIWQANDGDAMSQQAHTEAMVKRYCPVLVEPGTPVRITPQDPLNCTVATASGDPRLVLAGLKRWRDEASDRWLYTLYLPDRVERWQEAAPEGATASAIRNTLGEVPTKFEPRTMPAGEDWAVTNPLGEVPLVLIPNQSRVDGTCYAEHEAVLPLIDLYNKTLLDMATTSEFAAFPQRYGIGVEFGEDEQPATTAGDAVALQVQGLARFRAAVDAMITTPSPDAQFGQFPAADLSGYVRALEQITTNIGTITFTPYHLLLNMPTAVPATGEALKAAEVGLVAKCRDHQREKGVAWERVLRLALRLDGKASQAEALGEVIWRDAETKGEAQHVDALTKLRRMLGLPQEAAWELLPASPVQIERWRAQQQEEAAKLAELVGQDMANRIMAGSLAGGSIPDAATPAPDAPSGPPPPPPVSTGPAGPAGPPSGPVDSTQPLA